jgi:hypothetical protein
MERGTLRQIMSNPVPRHSLILGKYISGMLTLIIPLILGLLLNLTIVSFSGLSLFSRAQWERILAFLGISILYLSIFVILGILVSGRSTKSSISIAILLFIWVILAMIIPCAGRIVAERFVEVPTHAELGRQVKDAQDDIWANSERYGENAGNWNPDLSVDWVNPPARARLYNALADTENRMREEYVNRMVAQISLGRNVTQISPTVIYQRASEAIIGTGVARFQNLYNQLKRYRESLQGFVLGIDEKDPDSYHLWAKGHKVLLSQKPVDYNSIPRFEEIDAPMNSVLRSALWDIGTLVLLNLFLFMSAYISFLRRDVR